MSDVSFRHQILGFVVTSLCLESVYTVMDYELQLQFKITRLVDQKDSGLYFILISILCRV